MALGFPAVSSGQSNPTFQDVLNRVKQGKTGSPSVQNPTPRNTLEPRQRAIQVFSGIYEIDLVAAPGKQRARTLILGSGERLVMGYGLKPDEFHFIDRSVQVRGHRFRSEAGQFQQAQGHLAVSQIGLAPGEKPNPDADAALPTPPPIRTLDDFIARAGRWSLLKASIVNVTSDPQRGAHRALLKLSDGTRFQVDYLGSDQARKWRKLQGRKMTLIGRPRLAQPFRVDGPTALCPTSHPVCSLL